MDKKIANFAVPFLITVSAVFVGVGLYNYVEKRMAKRKAAKVEAAK